MIAKVFYDLIKIERWELHAVPEPWREDVQKMIES